MGRIMRLSQDTSDSQSPVGPLLHETEEKSPDTSGGSASTVPNASQSPDTVSRGHDESEYFDKQDTFGWPLHRT
jgi:hypothetical protein